MVGKKRLRCGNERSMNEKLTTDTKESVQLEDLARLLVGVMERLEKVTLHA